MNRTVKIFALTAILGAAFAVAQNKTTPQAHKGAAETTLIGVSLFDTGQKLIAKFGSPNEIQGLALGSTGAGGGAAGSGAGRGGPAGAGAGKSGGTGGGIVPGVEDVFGDPFDTGKTAWQEIQGSSVPGVNAPPPSGGGQASSAGGAKGGGATGGVTQGSGSIVTYTRWVYNKGASRYAFVLDKFSRVVQIEAFGLWDSRVKTRRGAMFGSSFGTLVKKYNAPDGYEINGDTIVMRYLSRDHVAFRLQRTDPKKGHVVTGIVVAAGK